MLSNSPDIKNLQDHVMIINILLKDFTRKKGSQIEEKITGNPWLLLEMDGEIYEDLSCFHTVNYHLKRIPYVAVNMAEIDGVSTPQITMELVEELVEDTINRSDQRVLYRNFINLLESFIYD